MSLGVRAGLRHIRGAEHRGWHLGKKNSLSLQLRIKGKVERGPEVQSCTGPSWWSRRVQTPRTAPGLRQNLQALLQRRGTNSRTMKSPMEGEPQVRVLLNKHHWEQLEKPELQLCRCRQGFQGAAHGEWICSAGQVSTSWWELVVQNDRDWTCKVLTGDSARAFHTEIIRIITQIAQLDTIHLIFKNTNSFSGLFPALGKMKWRQVAVLWLCSSPQPGSGHSHRRPALTLHRAEGMATPLLQ